MSKRLEFATALKSHDWYYAYSDDHRYWTRGTAQRRELNTLHKQLDCPFSLVELQAWTSNMIVEQFTEDANGGWYREPRKYKSVAPTTRGHLILQSQWDDIEAWINE